MNKKKKISTEESQNTQDGCEEKQTIQDGSDESCQQKTGLKATRDAKRPNQECWESAFDYLYKKSKKDNLGTFLKESSKLLTKCAENLCLHPLLKKYHSVFLWTKAPLTDFHLNKIHERLKEEKAKSKDILLILDNYGGQIEPAFQISKICNKYKKENFIVAIPRRAKSAATLISIGANQIHMGDLSQLGPIDPQLPHGIPALGIHDALNTLAKVVKEYPESVDLFSQFLDKKINLQILGWLARVPASASQYAQKLLSINYGEDQYKENIKKIAKDLVEAYKDHGFVIDADEAKIILKDIDEAMIQTNTDLINEIENFYSNLSEFKNYTEWTWGNEDFSLQLHIHIVGRPECNVFHTIHKRTQD